MNEALVLKCAVDSAHAIAQEEFDERDFAERLAAVFDADGAVAVMTIETLPAPHIGLVVGGGPPGSDETITRAVPLAAKHPAAIANRRVGAARPVRLSDEVNLRWFWTTETWWVMHHPWNGRYSMGASLYSGKDALVFLGMNRARRDFTDDEMHALARLQQPVAAAFRYRRAMHSALDELAALTDCASSGEGGRRLVNGIRQEPTRREAEVLTLMAAGWTNDQIASRLFITERTVRKHLSSVYEKAGLPGRAAAASWWERRQHFS